MSLLQSIKATFFPSEPKKTFDTSFVFPYSNEKEIKRQQVWANLQKGLLLEDTGVLIPWETPFTDLDKFAEQRRDRGDRTNWFLGTHPILDGYTCFIGVMKWITIKKTNPFSAIEEWLGVDYEGNQKFLWLKNHLTDLLGEPTLVDLQKFNEFDLGSIEWTYQKVQISLIGIEQFECKYRLHVGLADNKNRL